MYFYKHSVLFPIRCTDEMGCANLDKIKRHAINEFIVKIDPIVNVLEGAVSLRKQLFATKPNVCQ